MNFKNSQISIFVIISVIVLILGIFSYAMLNNSGNLSLFETTTTQPKLIDNRQINIQNNIETCLSLVVDEQFDFNLLSGGYYELPPLFAYDVYLTVPFYVYNGEERIPSLSVLEEQLALAIEDNIEYCIDNLNIYNESYDTINVSNDYDVGVEVFEEVLVATMSTDISFSNTNLNGDLVESFNLNEFRIEERSDLLEKYYLITEFIELHNGDFSKIPISGLNMLGYENDFTYEMKPQNADIIIYNFIFEEDLSISEYQFAINYNWGFE
ncbi:MAG: hypothetical protein ACLFPL_05295 [Candidatus Nanoarchaeia archaeon]